LIGIDRLKAKAAATGATGVAGLLTAVALTALLVTLLEPLVGLGWAFTIVFAAFAFLAWVFALAMKGKAMRLGPTRRADDDDRERPHPVSALAGLSDGAVDLVRQRPLMAAAAALAGGFLIVRNPALVGLLTAALSARTRRF
jgi:protein-S-isoprenylcysteine O-methyltransferase Ste14